MNDTTKQVISSKARATLTKPEDAPSTATIANEQARALALPTAHAGTRAWGHGGAGLCEPAPWATHLLAFTHDSRASISLPCRAHPLIASLRRAEQKAACEIAAQVASSQAIPKDSPKNNKNPDRATSINAELDPAQA